MGRPSIIVIGAGIGGLALALALQRCGTSVAIYERVPDIREVGAGVMLTPNSIRVLEHLGVIECVKKEATYPRITQTKHFQTGETLSQTDLGQVFTDRYGKPYIDVHRVHIHTALKAAVEANDPNCIHLEHEFIGSEQVGPTVIARFANGTQISGELLVGCDGVRSKVRTSIGVSKGATFTHNVAWRGLLSVTDLPSHQRGPEITIWTGSDLHFVEYTIKKGTLKNYVAIARQDEWENEGWSKYANVSEPLKAFNGWHEDVISILSATPKNSCLKWGLFDHEPLSHWSRGAITLLGDACHPMLPFMAQGAAMALEDAVVLSRFLHLPLSVEAALQKYETERLERTAWCQIQSRERGKMYHRIATTEELDADREERGQLLYSYDATTVDIQA